MMHAPSSRTKGTQLVGDMLSAVAEVKIDA